MAVPVTLSLVPNSQYNLIGRRHQMSVIRISREGLMMTLIKNFREIAQTFALLKKYIPLRK